MHGAPTVAPPDDEVTNRGEFARSCDVVSTECVNNTMRIIELYTMVNNYTISGVR